MSHDSNRGRGGRDSGPARGDRNGQDRGRPRGNRGGADRGRPGFEERPARRNSEQGQVPRPRLREDVPRVPKHVMADLRAAAPQHRLDDLRRAMAEAGEVLEAGDVTRALELLRWAKSVASKSAAVREAYGIALYMGGDFPAAHSELLTYRRLTNRHDQNHLLADCARAMERPEKVDEYVEAMVAADVGRDRVAEALIVQSASRADRGDLRGALEVLQRGDLRPERVAPWHPRLWYAAGDLSERMGEIDAARGYFEAIVAVGDDFLDAEERLAELER